VSDAAWVHSAAQWTVDLEFRVGLASQWKARGKSPSEVRSHESIRFWFPEDYPASAPTPTLRSDFPLNLPHIQPWRHQNFPVPCIYNGPLDELLHSEGISGLLNQMSDWLHRAAFESHNDEEQGWEPARRDDLRDSFIGDPTSLRALTKGKAEFASRMVHYLLAPDADHEPGVLLGQGTDERCELNAKNLHEKLVRRALSDDGECGISLLVATWPGKDPAGKPIINEEYRPDYVSNLADLLDQAAWLECRSRLQSALQRIGDCWPKRQGNAPSVLVVVLLADRPFRVRGSDSHWELFPYLVDARLTGSGFLSEDSIVRPMAHLDCITPALLARLSGAKQFHTSPRWCLIGAGSVGSNLAVGLARSGCGPAAIIDGAFPRPHNVARHALLPQTRGGELSWVAESKAEKLANAVIALGSDCVPFPRAIESQIKPDGRAGGFWSNKTRAIVNATASLGVRERLANADKVPAPVIECALFAGGRLGVITAESASRNPNTNDLMAECYMHVAALPDLASAMFSDEPAIARQRIGEGCGSPTMVLPDTRVSLISAGMGEYLRTRLENDADPRSGELLVGTASDDGMSIDWRTESIAPVTTVRPVNHRGWEVRIHARAARKIDEEFGRCDEVETGGVLIGRLSEVCRTINVVDVLDAPEDSVRSVSRFDLGRRGLLAAITRYAAQTGTALYCVGTWHSHLAPSDPSATDRETAHVLSVSRLVPAVLLIRTPDDYRALLADPSERPAMRGIG